MFKDYRNCHLEILFGKVAYLRAYYHCAHCHGGWFPTDSELRIAQKQTPAARELVTLARTVHPFAEGAEQVLERMSGLRVSASTVQRTTEAVGAEVAQHERSTAPEDTPPGSWTFERDTTRQRIGYVSLDARSVPQQGPHGEEVEGRMPYVGVVFNPQPQRVHQRAARRLKATRSHPLLKHNA